MRFRQLDKITELVNGERIVAVRHVRPDEDYLRDHFGNYTLAFSMSVIISLLGAASIWMAAPGKIRAVAGRLKRVPA